MKIPFSVVIAIATVAGACRPLPAAPPHDAGPARLTGVTFTRSVGAQVQLTLRAPTATMATDGTGLRMDHPTGRFQPSPDASPLHIVGQRLEARPGVGEYVLTGVEVLDDMEGRSLRTPSVLSSLDAGMITAEGPLTMTGPNWEVVAAGGAQAAVDGHGDVDLLGPIEARAWPVDASGGAGGHR